MYRTFRWCRLYKESRENVIVSFIVAVPVDGSFAVFSTFLGALSLHTLKMRLACSVINGCLDGWMLTMTTLKERGLHQYSIRNSKRAQWLFGVHGMDCHFWIKAPTLHAWPTTMYICPASTISGEFARWHILKKKKYTNDASKSCLIWKAKQDHLTSLSTTYS